MLAFDERVRRRDLVEMTRKPESSQPRKGMPSPKLGVDEFKRRFLDQSQDPAFSSLQAELSKMADAAGDGYLHSRKSPNTRKVGGYADTRTISSRVIGSMPWIRYVLPPRLPGTMKDTCQWWKARPDDDTWKRSCRGKAIELSGWDYPKYLAGRLFSLVVHGDAEGVIEVKRALFDWLTSMDRESVGATAELSRYLGYWKPYATSHEGLDRDLSLQDEVKVAPQTLAAVKAKRAGSAKSAAAKIRMPRQK